MLNPSNKRGAHQNSEPMNKNMGVLFTGSEDSTDGAVE